MFSSEILEIVIGLVFIYLILSLLGTTINESIAGLIHARGEVLKKSLRYMLQEHEGVDVFQKFVETPMFRKLRRNSNRKYPSYLSARKFSKILIEAITKDEESEKKLVIGDALSKIKGNTGKVLKSYWEENPNNISSVSTKY